MKVAIILLAALVAAVAASADYNNLAREDLVNSVNAARQARVNRIAESVGASSGLFRRYGVPGANPGYYGQYAGAPYYNGAYAYPGYGYPGYAYPTGY